MFSLKTEANSAHILIYTNILFLPFFLQVNDHVSYVIRQLIVLESVKDDKNFLSAQFWATVAMFKKRLRDNGWRNTYIMTSPL